MRRKRLSGESRPPLFQMLTLGLGWRSSPVSPRHRSQPRGCSRSVLSGGRATGCEKGKGRCPDKMRQDLHACVRSGRGIPKGKKDGRPNAARPPQLVCWPTHREVLEREGREDVQDHFGRRREQPLEDLGGVEFLARERGGTWGQGGMKRACKRWVTRVAGGQRQTSSRAKATLFQPRQGPAIPPDSPSPAP